MSNEAQYINPIIDTLFKTYQQNQNQQQLANQTQQLKQQQAYQQAALAQEQERIEQEHEQYLDTLHNVTMPQLESAIHSNRIANLGAAANLIKSGMSPQAFAGAAGLPFQNLPQNVPGVLSPGPTIDFGNGPMAVSDFYDPQKGIQLQQQTAEATAKGQTQGQYEAAEPFVEKHAAASLAAQEQLDSLKFKNDSDLKKLELLDEDKRAQLQRSTQIQMQGMSDATTLQSKSMEYEVTPQMANGLIQGAITGQIKLNPSNVRDDKILSIIQQNGFVLPDKNLIPELKTLYDAYNGIDTMTNFADKNLPDNKLKALEQGAIYKVGFGSSDIKNAYGDVQANISKIGKAVEGMSQGRILSTQMENEVKSLAAPGQTRTEGLQHAQTLRNMIQHEISTLTAGMPDSQKDIISKITGVPLEKMIPMKAPDGTISSVPQSKVGAYQLKGAVIVQ